MKTFEKSWQKIQSFFLKVPTWLWLLLLLLLPLNFFCLKESLLQKKNSAPQVLAFQNPETSLENNSSLEKLLAFQVFSEKDERGCQLKFLLDKKEANTEKIVLKKGENPFTFPSDLLEKLKAKKTGRVEVALDCPDSQENIYKNISIK